MHRRQNVCWHASTVAEGMLRGVVVQIGQNTPMAGRDGGGGGGDSDIMV